MEKKKPSDIIEIHNRPMYAQLLTENDTNKVLYFHNDPLSMNGSKSVNERLKLLKICSKIYLIAIGPKDRFLRFRKKFIQNNKN